MTTTSQPPARICRLTSTRTEMEAGVIVATLKENGINATFTGATTSGFRAEAPGEVHVLVAEDDLPRASAIVREALENHDDIDWAQVDVGEPEEPDDESYDAATLHDDSADNAPLPWFFRHKLWRNIAFVVSAIYLTWVAVEIAAALISLIARQLGAWG